MDLLCGSDNATWSWSLVDDCDVDAVNVVASCAVAYASLVAVTYLKCAQRRRDAAPPLLPLHSCRGLALLCLLLALLLELADGVLGYLRGPPAAVHVLATPVSALLAWCLALWWLRATELQVRRGGLAASGLLWALCAAARLLRLAALETHLGHVRPWAAAWAAAAFATLALLDLCTVMCCRRNSKENVSELSGDPAGPAQHVAYKHCQATLYSRLTFYWLTPLLRTGYSLPLEIEDLGQLPVEETTREQFANFTQIYNQEQVAAQRAQRRVSLWRCYFRSCWLLFSLGGVLKLLGDCVGFVGPLGISVIIDFVGELQDPSSLLEPSTTVQYPTWEELYCNGYVMGVVVFLSALAQGTFSQSSTHLVNLEGIHLKGALQALVYSKALRLCVWNIADHKDDSVTESEVGRPDSAVEKANGGSDNKTAKGTDVGAITNLMSEDAFNIMSFFWIGHYIWAIPLKIAVLMYLLHLKLGWSAIIGAAFCILIMTPLQFLIGKSMSSNSKAITDLSDERLRKMNEVLQGIKLLKLYGWECIYSRRIMKTRQKELKLLDKDSLYWALLTFLTHASSVLVTLVTFGVYFKMVGGALSPGTVFAGLALFNQLTVPLFIFPITVPVIINAMVSTCRLEDFLALPETTGAAASGDMHLPDTVLKSCKVLEVASEVPCQKKLEMVDLKHSQDDSVFGLGNIMEGEEDPEIQDFEEEFGNKVVVYVNNALFSWSGEGEKVLLTLENVTFLKGKLTMIVGRVGSGKSSLLSAVLGEMHMITGRVKWAEGSTVAYVAQKPWLLNGTLRDNILFGQKYRPRRYKRVISACVLQPDIDILPGKDYTEIGEKGINLSGGQKQRIAIARALYSEADVVILDDPLSALDYQVGQQVFEQGIKRFLIRQKRTVILVTHSLQLLPFAHKIVVMEGGSVRAQGSLCELEQNERQLVGGWKGAMSRQALEAQCCTPGRTAKERWRLVKLVSRIGLQLKQRNVVDGTWQTEEEAHVTPPLFTPLRKRVGTSFGSRYLAHDLPLPIDECEADFVERNGWYRSSLKRHRAATTTEASGQHKMVLRASSLQSGRNESLPYPVVRQFSSPSMHHDKLPSTTNRTRTYTVDSPNQGSLLRKLFSPSQSHRTLSSAPEVSGSIREKNILKRLMLSYSDKSCVVEECEKMPVKRLLSSASAVSDETNDDDELYEEAFDLTNGRLMSEEEREYGKISKLIYLEYLCACGVVAGLTYLVSAVVWQGLRVYTDYWLSQWTDENDVDSEQIKYYLVVYAGLSVASIFLSLTSNGIGQYAGAKARRILHDKMLCNILYCPMRFFESTPVGRVITRFSADMGVIDKKLATSIQRLLQFLLLCFSAIFVNAVVTPWFLLIAVLVCFVYYLVQHFYRCSSRELQRLDGITRSPIFSHFSETLTGLTTIRAFGHQQRFMDLLLQKMDVHTNAFLIMNTANRWLGIALDYLGAVIVFVAILTALVTASVYRGMVTPALVGLAVNYTLLIPIYLNWVVKFLADMEMYMGAVERVQQYAKTPTEDYRREGTSVSQSWPEKGDILFENVSLCYDKNRDPIITNLNLHIPAGQKVGLCGRTGCGKSSLVMSLFNMVEVYEGSIKIDGVDISKVPLQLLRSRLSIIPQDVIMFSGTIRDNLDPNHQYTDHELWRSLELSQLADVVRSYPGGLDSEVREGGENLSVGERQLFCLARAILHNAACLVMDEATSSVDPATERALMAAAAKAFSVRTVINIAHRLPTILDCDRIIVLDGGKVVEDGTPTELLHRPLSILTSMLRASEETAPR